MVVPLDKAGESKLSQIEKLLIKELADEVAGGKSFTSNDQRIFDMRRKGIDVQKEIKEDLKGRGLKANVFVSAAGGNHKIIVKGLKKIGGKQNTQQASQPKPIQKQVSRAPQEVTIPKSALEAHESEDLRVLWEARGALISVANNPNSSSEVREKAEAELTRVSDKLRGVGGGALIEKKITRFEMPSIRLSVNDVSELMAQREQLAKATLSLAFVRDPRVRDERARDIQKLSYQLEGRINELSMEKPKVSEQLAKYEEVPSFVESAQAPNVIEKKEPEAARKKRQKAGGVKKGFKKMSNMLRNWEVHGSSFEEAARVHEEELIPEQESKVKAIRRELEGRRSLISLSEVEGADVSQEKQEYNRLVDELRKEEETARMLAEEKEAAKKLAARKHPRGKAGLSPSFLEKLMRESAKKREKTASEQLFFAKKEREDAQKLREISKWKRRGKAK
jgi:hypothetical protein